MHSIKHFSGCRLVYQFAIQYVVGHIDGYIRFYLNDLLLSINNQNLPFLPIADNYYKYGILFKIRHYHNKQTLLNYVLHICVPYLIYGVSSMGSAPVSHINPFKNLYKNVYAQLLFQCM